MQQYIILVDKIQLVERFTHEKIPDIIFLAPRGGRESMCSLSTEAPGRCSWSDSHWLTAYIRIKVFLFLVQYTYRKFKIEGRVKVHIRIVSKKNWT
jgi:hypothetical protein